MTDEHSGNERGKLSGTNPKCWKVLDFDCLIAETVTDLAAAHHEKNYKPNQHLKTPLI